MPRVDQEVLEVLRRNGPSTAIEIAQRVSVDSLIVSAILVDAATQQKILKTKRRFGSSKVYYYPEQEKTMQKRVNDALTPDEKEIIQILMNEDIIGEFEINPQAAQAFVNLEDLIGAFSIEYQNRLIRFWHAPSLPEEKAKEIATNKILDAFSEKKTVPVEEKKVEVEPPKENVKPEKPKAEPEKEKVEPIKPKAEPEKPKAEPIPVKPPEPVQEIKRAEPSTKTPQVTELPPKEEPLKKDPQVTNDERERIREEIMAEMRGSFRDNVLQWFEKQEIDVIEEKVVKKGQEVELEVKVPTPISRQTYMVKVFDYSKKSASQNDVATVGMEAVSKRIPAIIISRTGFAKNAVKYWKKELEDLVTLVSEDDLE